MIRGFLLAVRDCCMASEKELGIPDFVVYELGKRAWPDSKDTSPVPSPVPPEDSVVRMADVIPAKYVDASEA